MPPGVYHAVFTATNSLASGGHFYNLHTMAQTAISRKIDVLLGDSTTNTAHSSVELLLHLMAQNLYATTRGRSFRLSHLQRTPDIFSKQSGSSRA